MCMFCAAVPVAGTVGANLHAKQRAARRKAEEEGKQPPKEKPIAKLTAGSIALLVICSAIYHLILFPHLRI
jgi:hypothetical protein